MRRIFSRAAWPTRELGATSIEYALMVVMVALVIIASAAILGGKVVSIFQDMATRL